MNRAFQTSSDLGVSLPAGSDVADDRDIIVGITSVITGNPTEEEIGIITAILLGLQAGMSEVEAEDVDLQQAISWRSASLAEHMGQAPLVSASDPRLNANNRRRWFARR